MAAKKFGFTDLITLAKSGWTPEKVNETLDRIETMNQDDEDESNENESESHENESESHEVESESSDNEEDEKDKKIKELEAKIEKLQKDNSHQNNDSGEKKSLDDMVDDIFKEFFD